MKVIALGGRRKTRCYQVLPPVTVVSWNSLAKPAGPMAQGHTRSQSTWYHDVTKRLLFFILSP